MEIRISFNPKNPKSPQKQFSPNEVRKMFAKNTGFFRFLIKCGFTEEEASIEVVKNYIYR